MPITFSTLQRSRSWANNAAATTRRAQGLILPAGQSTGPAKNTAKLAIRPTTTAVIALNGAPKRMSPLEASTSGAPARMNPKEGRKVNHTVTRVAAIARSQFSAPAARPWFQPPMKPTKATTMINGPGVVSPRAMPSSIWLAESQWNCSTAPCAT